MKNITAVLILSLAFALATVTASFSRVNVDEGPCKMPCKSWGYNLHINDKYVCNNPYQGSITCPPCPEFDYESAWGYCTTPNRGGVSNYNAHGIVFKVCDCPDVVFDINKSYGIKIDILEPATGVYFTNGNDSGGAYASCVAGCPDVSGQNIYVSSLGDTADETRFCPNPCNGTPFTMGYVPLLDSEILFDAAVHDKTDGSKCCLDCIGNLAKGIKTTCLQPFMLSASPYIMIDIPTMVWDPKIISRGDNVIIKVTITGEAGTEVCSACNDLCSCTVMVGIFGCGDELRVAAKKCITCFPYFTGLDDAAWWAGFALTNSGYQDADVKITFTAGGKDVPVHLKVPARSVLVKSLSELDIAVLAGKGPIFAVAESTVPQGEGTIAAHISGFAIMGDNNQAYGYRAGNGEDCGCLN